MTKKKAEQMLQDAALEAGAVSENTELTHLIRDFNARFYVVGNFGGRCVVCWESANPVTKTLLLGHQSFKDFYNRYMHETVQVGVDDKGKPEYKSKARVWLGSWLRRQYSEVVFAPGETLAPDIRNLWRGFAYTPEKGNCGLYLDHLRDNICGGEQQKYDWLLCWMAFKVRNPGLPGYTAVVLKGREGIGKNMAADPFGSLFGAHHICVTKREHVAGHFNNHLRACCVMIANEAFFAGDRQHQATLKGLITDSFLMIEAKGIDAIPSRNRLSLIVISNESWVVPAGVDARRFAVFNCRDAHREDTLYFGAIQKQLDHGGYGALLHHLLHEVDITEFDQHKALRTEGLAEQQSQSLRGVEALWFECLHRGQLPGGFYNKGTFVRSERLLAWAKLQHRREWSDITSEQLGLLLGMNPRGTTKGMGFEKDRVRIDGKGDYVRVWKIPDLLEARKKWDSERFKVNWAIDTEREPGNDDTDEWEYVPCGDERPEKDARPAGTPANDTPF
jgi:hypothetical protein